MSKERNKASKLSLARETVANLCVSSGVKAGVGTYWTVSCGRTCGTTAIPMK